MSDELAARCERAMHVITPEGYILAGGRAVLFVLERIGWRCVSLTLSRRPFIWIVEAGYRLVARNRKLVSRMLYGRH
jgi:predicted DCC family thiol-disulfide oxidoreductase YuxK